MKIEARFNFKAPEIIEDVERFTITHGGLVLEVFAAKNGGLRIGLNAPFGDTLIVIPHANNIVAVYGGRVEDLKVPK